VTLRVEPPVSCRCAATLFWTRLKGRCASIAVPNRSRRTLSASTKISAWHARKAKKLDHGVADRANEFAASPVIPEGLPADMDGRLWPELEIAGGDRSMDGIRWDIPESETVITNLNDFNLAGGSITAKGKDRKG
jgi:hypothetical protein